MNIESFKEKLESERVQLEGELKRVGYQPNPESGEWVPKASDIEADQPDVNEVADAYEDSTEHVALVGDLSVRYQNILKALKKIEDGTYGVDELDGEPIEEERLAANPAARTRVANIEREGELD